MSIYEVPSSEWTTFFERFSQQHRKARLFVSIELAQQVTRSRVLIANDSLLGQIEFGVEHGQPSIGLLLADRSVSFRFPFPTRVCFDQPNGSSPKTLQIHLHPNRLVTLEFPEPPATAELDGVS